MAAVVCTDRILEAIDTVLSQTDLPGDLQKELSRYKDSHSSDKPGNIPFQTVQKLQERLEDGEKKQYLHELLEGSDVFFPPVETPPRNPELVARLERLKREQENRQYAQMTRDMGKKPGQGALSDFGSEDGDDDNVSPKEVKVYLMALINFMVSVAAAFTFGYVGSEYAFGASVTLRVMTGIILATMVAMADIYFMAKVVEEEVEKHEKRN
ncbi:transmembrane protein 199-like isoform X2 [Branchiostoma floridae]|uniref:Transmembrane protein 199-like isoform X2 n=1 Tax=Branchiostoma floridae TaxID=7739 RepID=A0A9J7LY74_BRAFL|nr:transmembrane protein 199-like isoform X2 [Branchiostoma floridae]